MTAITFENGRIRFFGGKPGAGDSCCTCCWGCRPGLVPSLTVYGAKGGTEAFQFSEIPFSNGASYLPVATIGDENGQPGDTYLVRSADCNSYDSNSIARPYHPYLTRYSIYLQKIIIEDFGTSNLFQCQVFFDSGTSIGLGLGEILVTVQSTMITPANYDAWKDGLQPFNDTTSQHTRLFSCNEYLPRPLPAFDTESMTLDTCTTGGAADDPCPARVVFNSLGA